MPRKEEEEEIEYRGSVGAMGQLNAWAQSVIIAGECGVRESTIFVKTYFPNQYIKKYNFILFVWRSKPSFVDRMVESNKNNFLFFLGTYLLPFSFPPLLEVRVEKNKTFLYGTRREGGRRKWEMQHSLLYQESLL